ncbi:MAG: alpha/beta fold hydrolase [Kineosporiaceae bacterium]
MIPNPPVVVLVHGAFAESASWDPVIPLLSEQSLDVVAVANPLRGVTADAAYLSDVVAGLGRPVVLVGHSYGGLVITAAADGDDAVTALVYVAAFAPDHGESAIELSGRFPGSTLGDTLLRYHLTGDGDEVRIDPARFHDQFAADVPADRAALMAVTQRPVTVAALTEGLTSAEPAWRRLPSWFVFGDLDRNIPVAQLRAMAERAGARGVREVAGASHAITVSQPGPVADAVLTAVRETAGVR